MPDAAPALPRWRLRLRLFFAFGLVMLLLALLPPLINVNRYQRQVARSMGLSLGRPVHLDNVSFHLLPVPGLTLSNLVVSEDPDFGSEPTIRANIVEASLRLSSLWRRRVEFSTVRFTEPSVNLVRNQAGHWNLADVLLHAAHANTAPTGQRRAGPAPRFPYIEAVGARVNVKLGEEKLPYSLLGADFALWQPSPHQWRVRLRGQPERTDADMTDPGVIRLQGDLFQAPAEQNVRVDLRANWHDAPVGEATRLLLGEDLGWRGSVNLEATLAGTLDQAALQTQLTLGGLRRAAFAPAHPLDIQIACGAALSIDTVTVRQLACTLPDSAPQPAILSAPFLNLQHPGEAEVHVLATGVPAHWALLWAGLFSPRVAVDVPAAATVNVQLDHPGSAPGASGWTGSARLLPDPVQGTAGFAPLELDLTPAQEGQPALRLTPATMHPDPGSSYTLMGSATSTGYTYSVAGSADRNGILGAAQWFPQLGNGMDSVLPPDSEAQAVSRVSFLCSAAWGSSQVCTPATQPAPKAHAASGRKR